MLEIREILEASSLHFPSRWGMSGLQHEAPGGPPGAPHVCAGMRSEPSDSREGNWAGEENLRRARSGGGDQMAACTG